MLFRTIIQLYNCDVTNFEFCEFHKNKKSKCLENEALIFLQMKKVNALYQGLIYCKTWLFSAGNLLLTFCKKEICLFGLLQIKTRSLRLEMVTNVNTWICC